LLIGRGNDSLGLIRDIGKNRIELSKLDLLNFKMLIIIYFFFPVNIDMGLRFEYNDKLAYPIYILKENGQVDCLIEYEA
jgi:hypothetical protein